MEVRDQCKLLKMLNAQELLLEETPEDWRVDNVLRLNIQIGLSEGF